MSDTFDSERVGLVGLCWRTPLYLVDMVHSFLDWPDNQSRFGALVLYFAGCDFGCLGCHNQVFKNYSTLAHSEDEILTSVEEAGKNMPHGFYEHLVLSGGDPLGTYNAKSTVQLVKRLRSDYSITIYTGQEVDWVRDHEISGFSYIKCGKFNPRKAQVSGHRDGAFHLASTNQVLLDKDKRVISNGGVFRYS